MSPSVRYASRPAWVLDDWLADQIDSSLDFNILRFPHIDTYRLQEETRIVKMIVSNSGMSIR